MCAYFGSMLVVIWFQSFDVGILVNFSWFRRGLVSKRMANWTDVETAEPNTVETDTIFRTGTTENGYADCQFYMTEWNCARLKSFATCALICTSKREILVLCTYVFVCCNAYPIPNGCPVIGHRNIPLFCGTAQNLAKWLQKTCRSGTASDCYQYAVTFFPLCGATFTAKKKQ